MKKIEAYIRHEAFEPIRADLYAAGLPSMTVTDALGSGRQGGIVEHYRGATETLFLRPTMKLEIVVADEDVDRVISIVLAGGSSGEMGDGKIFVLPVERAVRIRTGEDADAVVAAHEVIG